VINNYNDISVNNEVDSILSKNLILYGAPGTGKSFKLNELKEKYFKMPWLYKRVTFYPNYSYAQFVGAYKPSPCYKEGTEYTVKNIFGNIIDEPIINYEYIAGPFLTMILKAIINPSNNYLLIIEEINRGDAASIFGDLFQILDRDSNGESEYRIALSNELKHHIDSNISDEYGQLKEELLEQGLYLPKNLYIWATMNSADQGVHPLDSAFKRRWDFKYINIDEKSELIQNKFVNINGIGSIEWNKFRQELNKKMLADNIKEDKLIGPFFIKLKAIENQELFDEVFKNKLLMYLCEDVYRHGKDRLFYKNSFSEILKQYESENIFKIDFHES